jgi:hypothetical protein
MSAKKSGAQACPFTEAARVEWMYHWWLAMGGHGADFPGEILETLTEPQKFQLLAQSKRARGPRPA